MRQGKQGSGGVQAAEAVAARVAAEQALELVELTLTKAQQGKTLCIYIDKPEGVTLDDCERFHKAVQPLLEAVDYDFLEVSSPGVDRPIKTLRDFQKHRGERVEVRLFAPVDGIKQFEGTLDAMDEASVTVTPDTGVARTLPRKAVALLKPVIVFEDDEE